MRFVLPLALILVACGPSKAEKAASECEAASRTIDYDAAFEKCRDAVRLDPLNERLASLKHAAMNKRDARDFRIMEDRERREAMAERQTLAAERQAAAAEDLAAAQRRQER